METDDHFEPQSQPSTSCARSEQKPLNPNRSPYDAHKLVFDYLSLADLCAVGLTCKILLQTAGQYFHQYHLSQRVDFKCVDGSVKEFVNGHETNFGCFAWQLIIDGACGSYDSIIKIFRHIWGYENYDFKRIELHNIDHFVGLVVQCSKKVLAKIQTIKFVDCLLDASGYDEIIRLCTNVKCLQYTNTTYNLPDRHYPNIESLRIRCNDMEMEKLVAFLRINPQIKDIQFMRHIDLGQFAAMTIAEGMKFDLLLISYQTFHDAVAHINDWQETGFFKRLHITQTRIDILLFETIDKIKCITTPVELFLWQFNGTGWEGDVALPNVTKLTIAGKITLADVKLLAQCFPNLQELTSSNSVRSTEEIVRNLPKLETIIISEISGCAKFHIDTLNDAREKLKKQLTIHLPAKTFFKARWASVNLSSEWVKIERLEIK